jgi:hypothetical protein
MKSATLTSKPRAAKPHAEGADVAGNGPAQPAGERFLPGCGPRVRLRFAARCRPRFWPRVWLRVWLHYRLDAYARNLHAIAAQRENDFHAERLLHRAISTTRSRLQSL